MEFLPRPHEGGDTVLVKCRKSDILAAPGQDLFLCTSTPLHHASPHVRRLESQRASGRICLKRRWVGLNGICMQSSESRPCAVMSFVTASCPSTHPMTRSGQIRRYKDTGNYCNVSESSSARPWARVLSPRETRLEIHRIRSYVIESSSNIRHESFKGRIRFSSMPIRNESSRLQNSLRNSVCGIINVWYSFALPWGGSCKIEFMRIYSCVWRVRAWGSTPERWGCPWKPQWEGRLIAIVSSLTVTLNFIWHQKWVEML